MQCQESEIKKKMKENYVMLQYFVIMAFRARGNKQTSALLLSDQT